MDSIFVEGIAATVSAIIVFCGSVWLLLALVLGPRLAYFVTASITLGFLLLMGVVWSVGDSALGPVGELPSYTAVGAGDTPEEAGFGPAGDYPDGGGWFAPDPEDAGQAEIKTGAEGAATDALQEAIDEGEVTAFERADQAAADVDATQLLERDGTFYAAVTFNAVATEGDEEPDAPGDQDIQPEEGDGPAEDDDAAQEGPDPDAQAFVFLEQDPGNELGEARLISVGIFLLLVAHLAGLSFSERRARSAGTATT
ncbi:MAG TPA: hypothetical protein VHN37_03575 [Actinomycetota bacterium]|nr:hypothetical protein [Actinomycetota bacterium]